MFNLKQKLESEREKLKSIDKILSANTSPIEINNQNASASKFSAFDDASFGRSSNIMSKSFNENMFFNRNKIEVSHFDFNLNLDDDAKEEENKVLNNAIAIPIPTDSRTSTMKSSSRNNPQIDTESSDNASPLMMPKYHSSLSSINSPQDASSPKTNGNGSASGVVQRQIPKHKRPLTRYLPNFSLDFNMRRHIETAGHQLQLCPHVIIDGKQRVLLN